MKKNKIKLILLSFLLVILLILYGPNHEVRDLIITSFITTKSHQYIAKILYSSKTIEEVMKENKVIEEDLYTDLSMLDINDKVCKSKDDYKLIKFQSEYYKGYIVFIYDSSKVKLAVSSTINKKGEQIDKILEDNNGIVGTNASGFIDPNHQSNGAIAHGMIIKNHEIISNYDSLDYGGLIGFTDDNKLYLTTDKSDAENIYRDAMEFGPFLIVNGKSSEVIGNGGWGRAPRTAIGQMKDGTVIFLVIEGRTLTSMGATIKDLIEIFEKYEVVNAANLDGGASSELMINNKLINRNVSGYDNGRFMPTYWILER